MDRGIVYPGSIPLETDVLSAQRNAMVGLSKLAAAVLGTSTLANGLGVTPTSPASLQVNVAPGEIYALANLDSTAYSSLAADTAHQIVKQGISLNQATLNCPAPGTAGQSINYLIEASFAEVDGTPVALPYYNASNPSVAWSGPNNSGTQQNTVRAGTVTLTAKAGSAAATGSQSTPAPDTGALGLFVVTVANGQTTITAANITAYVGANILVARLPMVGSFQTATVLTASTTLVAQQVGQFFIGNTASATTLTLPLLSSVPLGASLTFSNGSVGTWSVQPAGANLFSANAVTLSSLKVLIGDTVTVTSDGTYWRVSSGTAALPFSSLFASSFAGNGYQKLPSGLLLQWGVAVTSSPGSATPVTFPLAFPNAVLALNVTAANSSSTTTSAWIDGVTTSGFNMRASVAAGCYYIALGN